MSIDDISRTAKTETKADTTKAKSGKNENGLNGVSSDLIIEVEKWLKAKQTQEAIIKAFIGVGWTEIDIKKVLLAKSTPQVPKVPEMPKLA